MTQHIYDTNIGQYRRLEWELISARIKNKSCDTEDEHRIADQIDVVWDACSAEEIDDIENNAPRYYDFLYEWNKSYLSIYECAQYFIDQHPKLLECDKKNWKIKTTQSSLFGTEWKENDAFLYCIIQEGSNCMVKTLCDRDFERLNKEYTFDRYASNAPIFVKK